jgi:hypothetical protein
MKRIGTLLLTLAFFYNVKAQVNEPYVLSDFTGKELGKMLEICHQGGFGILVQKTPFATYGHYEWNEAFAPQGDQSVKQMVAASEEAGVHLGVWVQENAIDTDDSYFSPEYYKQYRKGGRLELYDAISADETTIAIRRTEVLNTSSTLNLILIDDELISYATMEGSGDLTLIHRCTRGAYGTKAVAHGVNAEAYRIWGSPENFVEPEGELRDMVRNSLENRLQYFQVKLFQGDPGQDWIDESIRVSQVERWEQESPLSLGLFKIRISDSRRPATSMEELEWMLSKAASFDAGYGLVIDPLALKGHGMLDEMLETMNRWNRLQRTDAFTEQQEQLLRDPYLDWHLEQVDSLNSYLLYEQHISRRFRCDFKESEPGVLRTETWTWNSDEGGAFGLRIQVDGEVEVLNPMVNTSMGLVMFPCALKPGQRLLYDFGETAWVVDADYHKIEEVFIEGLAELEEGSNEVYFLCEVNPALKQRPVVSLRYITRSLQMVMEME